MTTAARNARPSRKALVVLGMHRSGTSALARVLSLRGAALPRRLMPANAGNRKGYWEPERIVALNERILASLGLEWNDAFAGDVLGDAGEVDRVFLEEARAIVAEEYGDAPLIVIKDPRCTLLQAFWREALEGMEVAMLRVVIGRPPDEVVASLLRRDGTSALGAALLYAAYGIAAARTPAPAAFLTYAQLLDDWRGQTDRIATSLGFHWPRLPANAKSEIGQFLAAAGKPVPALDLPADVARLCEQVWESLRALASGKRPDAARLDALGESLSQRVADARPLLLDKNVATRRLSGQVDTLQAERARAEGRLRAERESGERAVRERDEALAERDRALEVLRKAEAQLRKAQADHAAAVKELAAERKSGAQAAQERDAALAERDRALEVYRKAEAELRKAQADHAAAMRELAAERKSGAQSAQERDAALAERDRALEVYRKAEAELRKAQADHAAAEKELAAERDSGQRAVRERDAALAERDRALEVFHKAEAELRKAQADHAAAEKALSAERDSGQQAVRERDDALADRDRALDAYRQAEAGLRKARADHAAAGKALAAERQSGQEAVRQRDLALSERDRALAALADAATELRRAQADHARATAQLAEAEAQRDQFQAEGNAQAEARAALERDLEQSRSEHDALLRERDDLLGLYRRTDELLRKAQHDYVAMERRAQTLDTEYRRMAGFAREIVASRSWRLTRPLRAIVRRLRGHGAVDPAFPVFREPEPPPVPVSADGAPVEGIPAGEAMTPPQVPQSLNDFLFDEFGPEAAADVTARIRHYRLPVDMREVRGASALACSEEQALAWARALAAKARARDDGPPDVSIVMPVYNQIAFTLAAIDSLLSHESRYRFEILVGDDASNDATAVALGEPIDGVRHVRHAENLGFVRNCNATASHARGRYVLFLNNDTQVLPGWLDELVGTLEDDAEVGLSGSKLIYPDGRLQECGAIVWRDGSAWNFGRLQDPRRPEFSYRRDVDYVSGASIALRRELWESLGGFDELFVPAYAEDADLAFRVRARGLRTVVQPLSQILHFEGISSGTDLGAGAKAYQVDNLRKLYERWKDVLATHRENADAPELEKERGVRGRVLFVDHCTPTPNEDAGSAVAFETMRGFLANGYKVTFIPEDNFAHVGAATRALQRIGIEAIYHPAYSRMADFLGERHDPFDLLFLHRFGVGEAHMAALRRQFPDARVLFLNADMHYLREMREAELSGDPGAAARAEATRARELAVIEAADTTLVHSEFELALLGRDLPGARVALYPLIHDPVERVAPLEGRRGVCFVGGFRHPPNADGIAWFVETAWPLVRAAVPEATLHIVGSHATDEVRALAGTEGVVVEGFVEDLDAYLAQRRVSVAPLRYGAGAKGKVAHSLAQGLPVVGTPIATEGMGLMAGEEVLVADTPEALAAALVDLLRNDGRWQSLSASGLAWAARTTSRASAHARLRRLLEG